MAKADDRRPVRRRDLVALAVVVLVAVGGSVIAIVARHDGHPAERPPARAASKYALPTTSFLAFTDDDRLVEVSAKDGRQVRQLGQWQLGGIGELSLSPDRATAWLIKGGGSCSAYVWRISLEDGTVTVLDTSTDTEAYSHWPQQSPNGRLLAYHRSGCDATRSTVVVEDLVDHRRVSLSGQFRDPRLEVLDAVAWVDDTELAVGSGGAIQLLAVDHDALRPTSTLHAPDVGCNLRRPVADAGRLLAVESCGTDREHIVTIDPTSGLVARDLELAGGLEFGTTLTPDPTSAGGFLVSTVAGEPQHPRDVLEIVGVNGGVRALATDRQYLGAAWGGVRSDQTRPVPPASTTCGSWSGERGDLAQHFGEIRNCALVHTTWLVATLAPPSGGSGHLLVYPCEASDPACLDGARDHPLSGWHDVPLPYVGSVTLLGGSTLQSVILDIGGHQVSFDIDTEHFG